MAHNWKLGENICYFLNVRDTSDSFSNILLTSEDLAHVYFFLKIVMNFSFVVVVVV